MKSKSSPGDYELLKKYRKGDLKALEELIARRRKGLFGYIYYTVQSQAEADDVYQEVWMRVIKKNESFHGGNFGGWLTRIAHNVIIDRVRRRRKQISLDAETPNGSSMKEMLHDPAAAMSSASLQESDIEQRVNEAVAELPLEQREVFLMRVKQDLPFKEIAKIQNTSINTALARMQYAIGKLRVSLAELSAELLPALSERPETPFLNTTN